MLVLYEHIVYKKSKARLLPLGQLFLVLLPRSHCQIVHPSCAQLGLGEGMG